MHEQDQMNKQHVEGQLCEWADYPAEPPHEKCDRPAVMKDAYSTQEGGSVELCLCAEHDRQIHGSSAAPRPTSASI
jgi:hypothetical protein